MKLIPIDPKNREPKSKALQEKSLDAQIEEMQCNNSLRRSLVYFHLLKDAVCLVFLLIMLTLLCLELVTMPFFFFSQVVNGLVYTKGKGLYRIVESLFPKKE